MGTIILYIQSNAHTYTTHTHSQIYTTLTVGMGTVSTMSPTMTEDSKEETKIDYPNLEMEEKTKEEEDITASEKDGLIPGKISQTASCARPYMDHKIDMSCCNGDTEGGKVLYCDQCQKTVITHVTTSNTCFGLFWLLCCLVGCCLQPIAFLPCCVKNFKEFNHRCPRCNKILTTSRYPFSKCMICFLVFLIVISCGFGGFFGLKYIGIIG